MEKEKKKEGLSVILQNHMENYALCSSVNIMYICYIESYYVID